MLTTMRTEKENSMYRELPDQKSFTRFLLALSTDQYVEFMHKLLSGKYSGMRLDFLHDGANMLMLSKDAE